MSKFSQRINLFYLAVLVSFISFSKPSFGHDFHGKAHYLANEGVVVESGDSKLMFDPFFHNNYGHYTLVPQEMRKAIFENKVPYDNINAIFISHAHGDHFDAADTLRYLLSHQNVNLFAPRQAVKQLESLEEYETIKDRIHSINLKKDEKAKQIKLDDMIVEAVRIPHAGWPQRAEIENIVFRVGGKDQLTVMHFGDADSDEAHYKIHQQFWQSKRTDVSFVPYWFGLVDSGKRLIKSGLNTEKAIGVHVPRNLPNQLKSIDFDYFHKPGESRIIDKKLD